MNAKLASRNLAHRRHYYSTLPRAYGLGATHRYTQRQRMTWFRLGRTAILSKLSEGA